MKYFTREFCDGDLSDQVYESRITDYKIYINKIHSNLPLELGKFYNEISLHDGKIINSVYKKNSLEIKLTIGDNLSGYKKIKVTYKMIIEDESNLKKIVKEISKIKNKNLVLYDEIEFVSTGCFNHNIIFWPKGELSINFYEFYFDYL